MRVFVEGKYLLAFMINFTFSPLKYLTKNLFSVIFGNLGSYFNFILIFITFILIF